MRKCYDNGCKPLKLNWVNKMKGEKCRSRFVCREIKRAKDRDEQLGPEDVQWSRKVFAVCSLPVRNFN